MTRLFRAAATATVAWACAWAHAQQAPAGQVEVQAALQAAQVAAAAAQWGQAELWLERALLLQPENAEARLLLAQLLIQRGRVAEGRLLIESLLADPRVVGEHRIRLQALVQSSATPQVGASAAGLTPPSNEGKPAEAPENQSTKIATRNDSGDLSMLSTPHLNGPTPPAAPSAARPGRGQVEALIGRSQNPLVQTSVREVALTLPDGALVLPLLSQPRPGTVASLRGQWEQPSDWGEWGVLSQLQTVSTADLPSIRLQSWWQWSPTWGAQFQAQRLSDGSRRAQWGLQAVWPVLLGAATEPALKGGVQVTTPASTSTAPSQTGQAAIVLQAGAYRELDTGRQGATARATALAATGPNGQALAWVEAEDNRSGLGAPGLAGAGLAWVAQIRNNIQLQAQVLEQQDLSGYSPLLENNAPRRLKTLTAQAEWAPGGQLQRGLVWRLQGGRRTANLPLFAWKDAGLSVLWRHSF